MSRGDGLEAAAVLVQPSSEDINTMQSIIFQDEFCVTSSCKVSYNGLFCNNQISLAKFILGILSNLV